MLKYQCSMKKILSLDQAIEFGEYHPEILTSFEEWEDLSRIMQFQLIRKALDNRYRHLVTQYAEVNNTLDFSKKPQLQGALKNIEEQLRQLQKDKEKLYVEYSV